ncbi:2'-5' RNA ligase family protein, partial [Trinickia caryophylli]|uniref:2'-5' RNA ligase family protein n=1 Tax=Trinickia caryophylli TaxID=28094 RepID=UPI000CC1DD5D
ELSDWGTFGVPASPRVLWCGVQGEMGRLHDLQQAVCGATGPLGFKEEEREYKPHITIARKYRGDMPFPAERLQTMRKSDREAGEVIDKRDWTVGALVLFATRMHQNPMYETVENIAFF